jgi:hypothetical protein
LILLVFAPSEGYRQREFNSKVGSLQRLFWNIDKEQLVLNSFWPLVFWCFLVSNSEEFLLEVSFRHIIFHQYDPF